METYVKQDTQDEAGGDIRFADLLIEYAKQAAAELGKQISQRSIDYFLQEVEKHRKNWEKRVRNTVY